MNRFTSYAAALCVVPLIGLAAPAAASIVSADFQISMDLPDFSVGPRVFENLDVALGAGDEIDDSHEIQNPENFSGHFSADLSAAGLLTLTGSQPFGFANYDLASITISNIVFDMGESILGVTELSSGLLDPDHGLGVIAPNISFASDSLTILFDSVGVGQDDDFEFLDGGVSTFQLDLGVSQVPLPAGLPLMLLGFGALGAVRARRKNAS